MYRWHSRRGRRETGPWNEARKQETFNPLSPSPFVVLSCWEMQFIVSRAFLSSRALSARHAVVHAQTRKTALTHTFANRNEGNGFKTGKILRASSFLTSLSPVIRFILPARNLVSLQPLSESHHPLPLPPHLDSSRFRGEIISRLSQRATHTDTHRPVLTKLNGHVLEILANSYWNFHRAHPDSRAAEFSNSKWNSWRIRPDRSKTTTL